MSKKSNKHGIEAFEKYYQEIFNKAGEYQDFIHGIKQKHLPILRTEPDKIEIIKKKWQEAGIDFQLTDYCKSAILWPNNFDQEQKLPGYEEHFFYPMNPSSLIPVIALNPETGNRVLDACAAPGGKALMIAQTIGNSGELLANDSSAQRLSRLKQTFSNFHITNTVYSNKSAETLFRKFPETFDKILLDAPCSSEKHVYNSPKHLAAWSKSRPKFLSIRQHSLLCGLFQCLKPEGELVYATCAITPEENEQVIEKFLKKRADIAEIMPIKLDKFPQEIFTKSTLKNALRIAPNNQFGFDPMFVVKIRKKSIA